MKHHLNVHVLQSLSALWMCNSDRASLDETQHHLSEKRKVVFKLMASFGMVHHGSLGLSPIVVDQAPGVCRGRPSPSLPLEEGTRAKGCHQRTEGLFCFLGQGWPGPHGHRTLFSLPSMLIDSSKDPHGRYRNQRRTAPIVTVESLFLLRAMFLWLAGGSWCVE